LVEFFWQKSWSISSWLRPSGKKLAEVELGQKFRLWACPRRVGGGRRGMGAEIGLRGPPSGDGLPRTVFAGNFGLHVETALAED